MKSALMLTPESSISIRIRQLVWLFVAITFGSVCGCGNVGGGASLVPEVTVIPADLSNPSSGSSEPDADSDGASVETASTGEGFGSIAGVVTLVGTAPGLPPIIAAGADVKDKEVCAASDLPDERLLIGEGNGVANVFIFMPKAPKGGKPLPETADPVIFDQKGCRFIPHALVVPTGRVVKVLSDDAVAHNTHTYPSKNDSVNSGVAPNDREGKLQFEYRRSESVPLSVTCDYHGWMKAFHLPVDHPYATVTDANGKFSIPDVPPGTHSFVVWHESVQGNFIERKLSVVVKPGTTAEVKIDLPVTKLAL